VWVLVWADHAWKQEGNSHIGWHSVPGAMGAAGLCAVFQDRWWQQLWLVICCVSCVMCCGAGHGVLTVRVQVRGYELGFCMMWRLNGVIGSVVGAHEQHTLWSSPLWGLPFFL
jgi:hypothetical protein